MKFGTLFFAIPLFGAVLAKEYSENEKCIWSCLNQAMRYSANCTAPTELDCVCHDDKYYDETKDCIKTVCTNAALDYAVSAKNVECFGH